MRLLGRQKISQKRKPAQLCCLFAQKNYVCRWKI